MSSGIFKLKVMTIILKINEKGSTSAYVLESSNLWHDRLGHVNFESLCS